jgi:hypothetical protein
MLIRIGNVLVNDKKIDSITDSTKGVKVSMGDGETREFLDAKLDDVAYPFALNQDTEIDIEMIKKMHEAGYELVGVDKVRA